MRAGTRLALAIAMMIGAGAPVTAKSVYPDDPLQSPMWVPHARTIFGKDPVRFDPRVKVMFPEIAENQRVFPVAVDARGIAGVKRMVIFADLNPIPIAIDYAIGAAQPYLATRIKLDQRTPVRGAVQLETGEWLVSGGWIDAAGGGCSAPPVSRVKGDWADHLGEIRGQAWPGAEAGTSRLRLNFRHPMDTGLVDNIATYHIEQIAIAGPAGRRIGELTIWASVSEDPAITVMPLAAAGDALAIDGRDTNGREYRAALTVAKLSPMPAERRP